MKLNSENLKIEKLQSKEKKKLEESKLKSLLTGVAHAKSANIPPLYGIYEGEQAFFVIYQYNGHSLYTLLKFSQTLLDNNTAKKKFIFYQLFQFLTQFHKRGLAHGHLQPSNCLVNEFLWVYVTGFNILYNPEKEKIEKKVPVMREMPRSMFTLTKKEFDHSLVSFSENNNFYEGEKVVIPRSSGEKTFGRVIGPTSKDAWRVLIETENFEIAWKDLKSNSIGKIPSALGIDGIQTYIMLWSRGEISNFEYLMILNTLSGRRKGDWQHPPVIPWVIDFTSPEGKYRDLTKTKYRLTKGDQMLDFTYNSHNPHHITEILSEITYFIYLARKTPISELKKYVRSNFEPKEYPSSMSRLYQWSPDECIPEFFSDPSIFKSIHKEMEDLNYPEWAKDPEDFIKKHRAALESDYVSRNLHHWIDLVFGYKLSGDPAIQSMNVVLENDSNQPSRSGFVQLFSDPHPYRLCVRNDIELDDEEFHHSKRHNTVIDQPQKLTKDDPRKTTQIWSLGIWNTSEQKKESKNINLPSYIHSNLHFISPLVSYEETMKFSSTYYGRKEYHILDFLKNNDKQTEFTDQELYANDLFALGCILAELYTFAPLFTTQKLMAYLEKHQGINQSILEDIPFAARPIVSSLISLKFPKKTNTLEWKRYFPSYFDFAYQFLSGFYSLSSVAERIAFFQLSEQRILNLSSEGFELIMSHIVGVLFSIKSFWNNSIKIFKSNELNEKIIECPKLKEDLWKKLRDCFDNSENLSLQQYLMTYQNAKFVYQLSLDTKTFLEQILPYYVDGLVNKDPKIGREACISLKLLATNEIGVFFTIQHIVDPVIERMNRRVTQGSKDDFKETKYLQQALMDISKTIGPGTLNYYLPRLFKMILETLKSIHNLEEGELRESRNIILQDLFEFIQNLLHIKNTSIINKSMEKNQEIIDEIIQYSFDLRLETFEKFTQIFSFIFSVCDFELRIRIIRNCIPTLKSLFKCEINIPKDVLSGITSTDDFENIEMEKKESKKVQIETKNDFSKLCILYKMLCCILGNSTIRQSIENSKLYEDELQSGLFNDFKEDQKDNTPNQAPLIDDQLFEELISFPKEQFSEPPWILSKEKSGFRNFKGILQREFGKLNDPIRTMDVSIDEKRFITGSKQSVNIWHLDNGKPILPLLFPKEIHKVMFWNDSGNKFIACDGTILIYDTEKKVPLNNFKNNNYTTFEKTTDPNLLMSATADGLIKFLDLRSNEDAYEWKLGLQMYPTVSRPTIKSLSYHPSGDIVSVGLSSGFICTFEQQSGMILDMFQAHAKDVYNIIPYGQDQFFSWTKTRKEDKQSLCLWNCSNIQTKLSKAFYGTLEPLLNVDINGDEIFGVTQTSFVRSSTKSPDRFTVMESYKPPLKKNVNFTFLKTLPIHKLMIAPTDDGMIKVYA